MQNNSDKVGTLYVVATPIGNLQDMTLRAIEILRKIDRIAAEDTRHAALLLKHFSIQKPTFSMHNFNEQDRTKAILAFLRQGESIALMSDAGTPLISDPGFYLIREAKRAGITVVPVPGACAAIAALSVAGLPADKFIFEGFLPAKTEARSQALTMLSSEKRTLIFYEAPHRLLITLQTMVDIFGPDRQAVVARELTKVHETVLSATLQSLHDHFKAHPGQQRGEIVLIVKGSDKEQLPNGLLVPEKILDILLSELPLKQAAALAAKITGERKNVLYELALAKKSPFNK